MKRLFLVICNEFKQIAKTKTYIFIIIAAPVFIAGILLLINYLPNVFHADKIKIGILCNNKSTVANLTKKFKKVDIFVVSHNNTKESLNKLVINGNINGYLVLPENLTKTNSVEYISKDMLNVQNTTIIKQIIQKYLTKERIKKYDLNPNIISSLTDFPEFKNIKITNLGYITKINIETTIGISMGLAGFLFALIMICGQFTARSILSEKKEKTVEIILSSISPLTLQMGKIVGICGAFLLQFTIWVLIVITVFIIYYPNFDISALSCISLSFFIYTLIFFTLGFFAFIAIFAGIGSIAIDERNLEQLLAPAILIAIIPLITGQFIIKNPSSTLNIILSIFPLTSSVTMPLRIFAGNVPFWQILLSIIVLILSVIFLFYISINIFKVGILITGKNFKLKDIKNILLSYKKF